MTAWISAAAVSPTSNRMTVSWELVPTRWEALYVKRTGFKVGDASACRFYRPKLQVTCAVRGDDFAFSGDEEAFDKI